jgi:hypothetical protein
VCSSDLTFLYAFAAAALKNAVRYAYHPEKFRFQTALYYAALLIAFTSAVSALSFGIDCLAFSYCKAQFLIPFVPLHFFIAFLLLGGTVFYYKNKAKAETPELENNEAAASREEKTDCLEQITVKTGQKLEVIQVSEIIYFQADGDYVQIHCTNKKYLKEQTMKYFDENLPPKTFVRIHRSFIVNIHHISRIERYEKQNQLLTLKNGEKLKVSSLGYQILKTRLGL